MPQHKKNSEGKTLASERPTPSKTRRDDKDDNKREDTPPKVVKRNAGAASSRGGGKGAPERRPPQPPKQQEPESAQNTSRGKRPDGKPESKAGEKGEMTKRTDAKEGDRREGGDDAPEAADRRPRRRGKEDAKELPADPNPVDAVWSVIKWLEELDIESTIAAALQVEGGDGAFAAVKSLQRPVVEKLLQEANLGGLSELILDGIDRLKDQGASTGFELNRRFKSEGKFDMAFGNLALFYGGLESLIGPPQMVDGSLITSMEHEHTQRSDARVTFTSSNGVCTNSFDEWEIGWEPVEGKVYAERGHGFAEDHPEWCRTPQPITDFEPEMEKVNRRLARDGHPSLILEEMMGGRLYTGPMYHKYNSVLRAKSGNPYLVEVCTKICKGNQYPTTIHAINSLIIKASKLTVATKVYRGFSYAKLPDSFWTRNTEGVRCGIEYGFSSTSYARSVAEHYSEGPASTLFDMQMGLIDRGAELAWISQYPHEAEILFPPLTGLEMSSAEVQKQRLVVHARLSVNLTALTLEQVVSKRRKMIMDMGDGMTSEIKAELRFDKNAENRALAEKAVRLLTKGLEAGPFAYQPEFYNDDVSFSAAVDQALGLKKTVLCDGLTLPTAVDERNPILGGSFKDYRPPRKNHQRVLLITAWLRWNPKVATLDLRNMALEPKEVEMVDGLILRNTSTIVAADLRGNPEMGVDMANYLVDKVLKDENNSIGSLCGVTKTKIGLSIPRKDIPPTDLIFIATELEAHSWSETSQGKGKPFAEIRRRSSHSYGDWSPLLFATREGIIQLCQIFIDRGHDIDQKDQDKLNPGYTPLITAATRGDLELCRLLVDAGADVLAGDRNGKTAMMLAEQRGFSDVAAFLKTVTPDKEEEAPESPELNSGAATAKAPGNPRRGSALAAPVAGYKGLLEKQANDEKKKLAVAAELVDDLVGKATVLEGQANEAYHAAKLAREKAETARANQQALQQRIQSRREKTIFKPPEKPDQRRSGGAAITGMAMALNPNLASVTNINPDAPRGSGSDMPRGAGWLAMRAVATKKKGGLKHAAELAAAEIEEEKRMSQILQDDKGRRGSTGRRLSWDPSMGDSKPSTARAEAKAGPAPAAAAAPRRQGYDWMVSSGAAGKGKR